MKYLSSFVVVMVLGVFLAACTPRTNQAVNDTTNAVNQGADQAREGLDQAGQAVNNAAQEVTDNLPSRTVKLAAQNNSGQSGEANISLTADGKVKVVLGMQGGTFTQPQPAHVHLGSCPKPGAVKYPLNNVVNGKSETILDINLSEVLESKEKLAINVHKSAAESSVYTACGDVM
jgi:hypothetical protein